MNVEFRCTKEVDWQQLLHLQHVAPWAGHRSLKQLKKAVANSQLLITGWDDTTLVACARILTDYVYRAVVFDVIVRPDYQGKGIGRDLMKRVIEDPSLREVEYFFLYTHDKEAFYHRIGWEEYSGTSFRFMNEHSPNLPEKRSDDSRHPLD
jgi:N-acetylglutamate synthase-like GNAT family acetyltransferase